jgi:hypothetical protein
MIRCEAYEFSVRGFATSKERVVWKLIIQRFCVSLAGASQWGQSRVTDLVEYDVNEKVWHKLCVEICQRFGQLFLLGKAELAGIYVELEERHFASREWTS